MPAGAAMPVKVAALAVAVVWGVCSAGASWAVWALPARARAVALVPGLAGGLVVAAAWWPAVVG